MGRTRRSERDAQKGQQQGRRRSQSRRRTLHRLLRVATHTEVFTPVRRSDRIRLHVRLFRKWVAQETTEALDFRIILFLNGKRNRLLCDIVSEYIFGID